MQGTTDQEQLLFISVLCGSITADVWPDVVTLEAFGSVDLPQNRTRKVRVYDAHYEYLKRLRI
jgi:cyclin-dependent kinase 9